MSSVTCKCFVAVRKRKFKVTWVSRKFNIVFSELRFCMLGPYGTKCLSCNCSHMLSSWWHPPPWKCCNAVATTHSLCERRSKYHLALCRSHDDCPHCSADCNSVLALVWQWRRAISVWVIQPLCNNCAYFVAGLGCDGGIASKPTDKPKNCLKLTHSLPAI